MSLTNIEIELQALITEREGMIAANQEREHRQEYPAYNEADFNHMAQRILDLKETPIIVVGE